MSDLDRLGETTDRLLESYRKHKVRRFLAERTLRGMIRFKFGSQATKPENNRGLMEGAILANTLSYPDENPGRITYKRAAPGRFVSYDANRLKIFPNLDPNDKAALIKEGKLAAFVLDEVRNNDPEERTPDLLFDPFNLEHILQINTYGPEELTDQGLLVLTTHQEAYDKVGLYDQYAQELTSRGVAEDPVFQVTPKGNTLIVLMNDGGSPQPKESPSPSYGWIPDIRAA